MAQAPFTVGGLPIPFESPALLAVVAVHVVAGLGCVLTGLAAMLARKGRGRHSMAGTLYYRSLTVVCMSMAILAAVRWREDYPLFILGSLAVTVAAAARLAIRRHRVRLHLTGMALSYILLLTAFYVDNGPHLPVWRTLPPVALWLLPSAIGVPLVARALRWHPLAREERRQVHAA